jgi:hypothetical protein
MVAIAFDCGGATSYSAISSSSGVTRLLSGRWNLPNFFCSRA